jgi:hypothetical protein
LHQGNLFAENSPAIHGWVIVCKMSKSRQGRKKFSTVPPGLLIFTPFNPAKALGYFQGAREDFAAPRLNLFKATASAVVAPKAVILA